MKTEDKQLDTLFSVLANRYRREIILKLSVQPASISELSEALNLSLPAIHKHITLLEVGGYVRRKKSGRTYFLALDRTGLLAAQEWIGQFHAYWGSNNETLENYVAGIERKKLQTKTKQKSYEKVHVSL